MVTLSMFGRKKFCIICNVREVIKQIDVSFRFLFLNINVIIE